MVVLGKHAYDSFAPSRGRGEGSPFEEHSMQLFSSTLNTTNMICGNNYTIKRGKAKGKLHHRHLHPLPPQYQQKHLQKQEEEQQLLSASRPASSLSFSTTRPSSSLSFFSTASTVLRVGEGANRKSSHNFNNTADEDTGSPLRAISRRGQPFDAQEIWEPPADLQRVSMPEGCTLFFPIELTGRDYMRRALDVVAQCLQGKVLRTMVKCVAP
jgi:hypothetical protein